MQRLAVDDGKLFGALVAPPLKREMIPAAQTLDRHQAVNLMTDAFEYLSVLQAPETVDKKS